MRIPELPIPASPPPLVRGVSVAFGVCLGLTLILAPTVFGHLRRLGDFDLLFTVCLLLTFWVVGGLIGTPLWHLRSWANFFLWGLLGLLLIQVLPLPWGSLLSGEAPTLGPSENVLVEPLPAAAFVRNESLPVSRYSLRASATVGVLVLAIGAAGLYWLVGSAAIGRKSLRRAGWAVLLGAAVLASWQIMEGVGGHLRTEGVDRPGGPVDILGGDSLVPALLAALPLSLAAALRPLGWMPRVLPRHRQSRWGWMARPVSVRGWMGVILAGLVAAALGMSNVPRPLLAVCMGLSVGFVLGGYVLAGPGRRGERRPLRLALILGLWVMAAAWLGSVLGPPRQPALAADDRLSVLLSRLPPERWVGGAGAGSVSSRACFGTAGWPVAPGDDRDTAGLLLVRAEMGWAGLALGLGLVAAWLLFLVSAWRQGRGPWPRTAILVGLGAVAANLLYFQCDAVALLAPNLLVLAGAMGVVMAWVAHGTAWRKGRPHRRDEVRWSLLVGAVGLLAALGLSEGEMLSAAGSSSAGDKTLHFGTFAVISLLLCYALGPRPTSHYLKTRIVLAVLLTAGLGVLMEFAQRWLTHGRAFELADMVANLLGASLMGLLWWLVRKGQEP